MNKINKCILNMMAMILFVSCSDWGKMDPPAGNQVFPAVEMLSSFTFDNLNDFTLHTYSGGDEPAVFEDEIHGNVLYLNGGYLEIDNPLLDADVESAVSLTFWLKQPGDALQAAIFSFGGDNPSNRVFVTANGNLSYNGEDGAHEYAHSAFANTGITSPDEWQFVALKVTKIGYYVWVDGEQIIRHIEPDFDYSKIVQFMASAPKIYIGYGSDTQAGEMWIDDMSVYRNEITDAHAKTPNVGGGASNIIIVGNEDKSTSWWSAFSPFVPMQGDQTMHFGFTNYTRSTNNWDNWVVVVTNGRDRGEAGYAEYFVLRADAYGWGDGNHTNDNITHDYDWDIFRTEMDGAYVDLTITRTDNRVDLTAVTNTAEGKVYTMTYFYEGSLAGTIGAFLTCEGAYLEINTETIYVGEVFDPGSYIVGLEDLTTPWWAHFSEFSLISGNTIFGYTFINYTNGTANWNNWLLVATNGKNRGEDGYAEYFVLRADAYGWGSLYSGSNISHSYNWDTYTSDMKGAHCAVIVKRDGNRIDVIAKVTKANGEKLGDYTFYCEGDLATEIGLFLLVEGGYLDIRSAAYYPLLKF